MESKNPDTIKKSAIDYEEKGAQSLTVKALKDICAISLMYRRTARFIHNYTLYITPSYCT